MKENKGPCFSVKAKYTFSFSPFITCEVCWRNFQQEDIPWTNCGSWRARARPGLSWRTAVRREPGLPWRTAAHGEGVRSPGEGPMLGQGKSVRSSRGTVTNWPFNSPSFHTEHARDSKYSWQYRPNTFAKCNFTWTFLWPRHLLLQH